MTEAVFLLLGTYLSCCLTKWYHFKETKARLYEAIIAVTKRDTLPVFLDNNCMITEAFFPIQIAFFASGHDRAAKRVKELADDMERAFVSLLVHPPAGQFEGHSVDLRFVLNATVLMRDSDFVARAEKIPADWEGILNPF